MDPPTLAVKFVDGSDSLVRGLGMPYGGPYGGLDFNGEFFSPKTDFMFDFFTGERPLLYDHGQEPAVDNEIVGRVVEFKQTDDGVWTIAQLDRRARYVDAIRDLVDRGALSFSSGAYPYLARTDKSTGEILRWPWVELSLTPTPANPYAYASKSIRAHLAIVTTDEEPEAPLRRVVLKAVWSAAFINALPDSAFACIDGSGRHYPHHGSGGALDLPHLRAALSRIGDSSNVQCGRRHLEAHARAAGVGNKG